MPCGIVFEEKMKDFKFGLEKIKEACDRDNQVIVYFHGFNFRYKNQQKFLDSEKIHCFMLTSKEQFIFSNGNLGELNCLKVPLKVTADCFSPFCVNSFVILSIFCASVLTA